MRKAIILTMVIAVALGVGVGMATAAGGGITIRTEGDEAFEANALIQSTFRFSNELTKIPSGGTFTFIKKDQVPDEPHTLTIVNAAALPKSVEDVFNCDVCNATLAAHFPAGGGVKLRVDKNSDGGLDVAGDSILILPGVNNSITAKVTAPAGTTLHFLCAFHPWMQGIIKVTS
jgi:hypothetical protein